MGKIITFVSSSEIKRLLDNLTVREKEKLLIEKINELPPESRAKIVKGIIPSINPETIFNQLTKLYKVNRKK